MLPTSSMSGVRKQRWQVADARRRRLLAAQEVGLERLHPRDCEQGRGVVAGRDQRGRGHAQVPALLEEGEICLADLVGSHAHASLGGRLGCIAVVAGLLALAPASASAANPVPGSAALRLDGRVGLETVSIPSLTQPGGITQFTRHDPAPGRRRPPSRARARWSCSSTGSAATSAPSGGPPRTSPGHGYIALVWTAPTGANQIEAFLNAVDAMRSALAFVRTPANPYLASSDDARIGARRPFARLDRRRLRAAASTSPGSGR